MKLKNISTCAPQKYNKEHTKKELQKLKFKLEELQNLLYAEAKHSLLIIIQGMDASGKDGAVKKVFEVVNPMGCRVIPFKKPTELEMKHDFLWRVHQQVPEKGMITIFNRSHYEDVLIQQVHQWVDNKTIKKRYENINDFEKLLIQNSTIILKFYLHVSREEQLKRLEERESDKTKMWKYDANDMKERSYWKEYMNAYEDTFKNCSQHVPWHIIPADQNWYKEYLMAKIIVETLEELKMKFPSMNKEEEK